MDFVLMGVVVESTRFETGVEQRVVSEGERGELERVSEEKMA